MTFVGFGGENTTNKPTKKKDNIAWENERFNDFENAWDSIRYWLLWILYFFKMHFLIYRRVYVKASGWWKFVR